MLPAVRFFEEITPLDSWIHGPCMLFLFIYTTTFAELYTEYGLIYMDGMGTTFKT